MRKEGIFSLGVLAFTLFYLLNSLKIPLGTFSEPGPGFLPMILSIVGVAISLFLVVTSFKKKGITETNEDNKENPKKILWYIVFSIIFTLIFNSVGTIVAVFILTFGLSKVSGLRGWRAPLVLSLCFSVSIYVVFAILLKVPLPNSFFQM